MCDSRQVSKTQNSNQQKSSGNTSCFTFPLPLLLPLPTAPYPLENLVNLVGKLQGAVYHDLHSQPILTVVPRASHYQILVICTYNEGKDLLLLFNCEAFL